MHKVECCNESLFMLRPMFTLKTSWVIQPKKPSNIQVLNSSNKKSSQRVYTTYIVTIYKYTYESFMNYITKHDVPEKRITPSIGKKGRGSFFVSPIQFDTFSGGDIAYIAAPLSVVFFVDILYERTSRDIESGLLRRYKFSKNHRSPNGTYVN